MKNLMNVPFRRAVAAVILTAFIATNSCYGLEPASGTLAPTTRMNSEEFRDAAQIQITIIEALKGAGRVDLDTLKGLGEREMLQTSIFPRALDGRRVKPTGKVMFDKAEEIAVPGNTDYSAIYAVTAQVDAADRMVEYVCLITIGKDAALPEITVVPRGVYEAAKRDGKVTRVRDLLDAETRSIIERYVEHEITTDNSAAIDGFIAAKMTGGDYAVDSYTAAHNPLYRASGRAQYDRKKMTGMLSRVSAFLRAAGVERRHKIIDAVNSKPLVLIPYDDMSELPEIKAGDGKVKVLAHSSHWATYIFLPRQSYDRIRLIESGQNWPGYLMEYIEKELVHEIGASCGLPAAVGRQSGRLENILDSEYEKYRASGSSVRYDIGNAEVLNTLKALAPRDLISLEARNDYASGKRMEPKMTFRRLILVALAALGIGALSKGAAYAGDIEITRLEEVRYGKKITFKGGPNEKFVIERAGSVQKLGSGNAQAIGVVSNAGPEYVFTDDNPPADQAFYRVRRVAGWKLSEEGGIERITYLDGSRDEYTEYWQWTGQVKTIANYDPNGNLTGVRYFDINGNPMPDQVTVTPWPAGGMNVNLPFSGNIATEYGAGGSAAGYTTNGVINADLVTGNTEDTGFAAAGPSYPGYRNFNNLTNITFDIMGDFPYMVMRLKDRNGRTVSVYLNGIKPGSRSAVTVPVSFLRQLDPYFDVWNIGEVKFIARGVSESGHVEVGTDQGTVTEPLSGDGVNMAAAAAPKAAEATGREAISEYVSMTAAGDADAITEVLWEAATEGTPEDEVKRRLAKLDRDTGRTAEEKDAGYEALIKASMSILLAMSMTVQGRHRQPDRAEIEKLAAYIKAAGIEVYVPESQISSESVRRFKGPLFEILGGQLRFYKSIEDLPRMVKDPGKAVVMAVGFTEDQALSLKAALGAEALSRIRILPFEGMDTGPDAISDEEYTNYVAETLSILLAARVISEEDANDTGSPAYRVLAHLLELHMDDPQALDGYIKNIASGSIDPIRRLQYLLKNILKAIPVTAYKLMRPAVEVLWSA